MTPKQAALLKKWEWYNELKEDMRKRFLPFFKDKVYLLIKDNQTLCLMMPQGVDILYRITDRYTRNSHKRIISKFNEVDNSKKEYVVIRFDVHYMGNDNHSY